MTNHFLTSSQAFARTRVALVWLCALLLVGLPAGRVSAGDTGPTPRLLPRVENAVYTLSDPGQLLGGHASPPADVVLTSAVQPAGYEVTDIKPAGQTRSDAGETPTVAAVSDRRPTVPSDSDRRPTVAAVTDRRPNVAGVADLRLPADTSDAPAWPPQASDFDAGETLKNLAEGTGVVLAMCVIGLWGVRQWLVKRSQPRGGGHALRTIESLSLPQRCQIHLVEVDGRRVLVGTDAAGLKGVTLLTSDFDDLVAARPEAADVAEEAEAGPHRSPLAALRPSATPKWEAS